MEKSQKQFLEKFIEVSSLKGVSEEVLQEASMETYGNGSAYVMDYYAGLSDIVQAIEAYFDKIMLDKLNGTDVKSVTERVRTALRERIYACGNRKNYYKKLSEFYLKPSNITLAAKNSWKTVDAIWRFAGDESLDFNYYSKRAILFTIYNSSVVNYKNSVGSDFTETERFIDKALEQVKKFNKLKQKFRPSNLPFVRLFKK